MFSVIKYRGQPATFCYFRAGRFSVGSEGPPMLAPARGEPPLAIEESSARSGIMPYPGPGLPPGQRSPRERDPINGSCRGSRATGTGAFGRRRGSNRFGERRREMSLVQPCLGCWKTSL